MMAFFLSFQPAFGDCCLFLVKLAGLTYWESEKLFFGCTNYWEVKFVTQNLQWRLVFFAEEVREGTMEEDLWKIQ